MDHVGEPPAPSRPSPGRRRLDQQTGRDDRPNPPCGDGCDHPPAIFSRRAALAMGTAAVIALTSPEAVGAGVGRAPRAAVGTSDAKAALSQTPAASAGTATVVDSLRPDIQPREVWGRDLPVTGDILAEEDVRFLLVHHTASSNDYNRDEVIDQIRDFYGFHTGPDKGWPDVAYNFFIDRFGGIWEARAGSIDGPVRGDATGGSQGFALLCSLIGDHSRVEVSPEALDSLTRLLAWLAERYDVDTTPGATVNFVSRGSNRWPAGVEVTANTISGHRDMSQTSCPGDFAYGLLPETIPARVSTVRLAAAEVAPEPSIPSTTSTVPTTAGVTIVTSSTTSTSAPPVTGDEQALSPPSGGGSTGTVAVLIGAVATVAAVIGAGAARFRRRADG